MNTQSSGPPLDGLRVLEITNGPPGQIAGMLFADLGADVVRLVHADSIEPPIGDLPAWLCWNRGKTLAVADGDTNRLLARADVVLHDLHPEQRSAEGFDAETVRTRFPALVDIWLAPIAATGRWAELPGDQLLLDAVSGFAAHHPASVERPVASAVATRHPVQGALAVTAAMSALIGRDSDGHGRSATISGLHAEAATLATLVSRSIDGPPIVSAGKSLQAGPFFRLYCAGDGQWFYLAALSPTLFIRALEVLDRLDLLVRPDVAGEFTNLMRPEIGTAVGAELEQVFAAAPVEHWIELFRAAEVPVAVVSDPARWLTGEVMAHACPPVERAHPRLGPVRLPGTPIDFSRAVIEVGELPRPDLVVPDSDVWADADPLPAPEGPPPNPDDRPLGHLRVIDTASFLAGPFVSTLLARHGADVVKLEAPDGDPYAAYSASYGIVNEHKPRLRLDLTDPSARDEFFELVTQADVVVDNLAASSLARLGLSPERFEQANPDLVRCSITAYGADGPFTDWPGFDPIMQSLSGLAAIQGGDGRPVATAAPVHDVATGCLGAIGTLAAVWARSPRRASNHRRPAQRAYASLAATSTFLQAAELTTFADRMKRTVGGSDFAGPTATHRLYSASDRWVAVAATTSELRRAMLGALGLGHDRDDERDDKDEEVLATRVQDVIGECSAASVVETLEAVGVPVCVAIERVELDDPFLVENDYSHVFDAPEIGRIEAASGYTDWNHVDRPPPLDPSRLVADRVDVVRRWSRGTSTRGSGT